METAARIASDCDVGKVGTEHVLLAILNDERSIASQVIAQSADTAVVLASLRQVLASSQYSAAHHRESGS